MSLINVEHIQKSFGLRSLLRDISFSIEEKECIGLVGINGCGKTTLMRILVGLETYDAGQIIMRKQLSVGLFRQIPEPEVDIDQIIEAGYDADLASSMNYLGLEADPFASPDTLSGGERTRLALARFLSVGYDLLLLDEPTNNMDFDGIQAAVQMLKEHPGSALIVSHDRYFLDRLVSRVFEIDQGILNEYTGNYSDYREQKQLQFEQQMHRYEADRKEQRKIEKAIVQTRQWADKAHRDSTKKDHSGLKMGVKENKRVKARKLDQKIKNDTKRLERKLQQQTTRPRTEADVSFEITLGGSKGRRMLEAADLAKKYDGRVLFENSFFYVQRGEKVAVFGPNGCGKTTLIRMIRQQVMPDRGEIWLSSGCHPYYLDQQINLMTVDEKLMKKPIQSTQSTQPIQSTQSIQPTQPTQSIQSIDRLQPIDRLSQAEESPSTGGEVGSAEEGSPSTSEQVNNDVERLGSAGEQVPTSGEQVSSADRESPSTGEQVKTDVKRLLFAGEQVPSSGVQARSADIESPSTGKQVKTGAERLGSAGEQVLGDYLTDRVGHLDGAKRAVIDQIGFSQQQLSQTLESLSPGEKMKVKLLEPILSDKDFLILDEPTNYLDLQTRETLEKALAAYNGTLLIISHDIYLMQRICNKTIVFEDKQIKRYEDTFAEYLEKQEDIVATLDD